MKKFIAILTVCLLAVTAGCAKPQESSGTAEDTEGSGIPVLYLTIDPDEFAKVNESTDHSYRASGATIRISVPEGYTSEYGAELLPETEEMELSYIRGRGHGTWGADKKPYRFKLEDSADLLGMGANKHWVLLANRYDTTLLRNRLIGYIGRELGLRFTPKSVPVELMVNGEYYGSYTLSEQVRIGKTRIDIDELTEEDIGEPEVTGGYLIYMNPDYEEPLENIFFTEHMVRFGVDSPQFTEEETGQPEQKDYIASYIQKTENAVYSDDFTDEDGISAAEYMDLQSAADYWWVQEYSGNNDAFSTNSTYLYKERSGKLFWGPLWDFDLALGNGLDATEGFLHRNMLWLDHLRAYNPEYQELLRERWKVLDGILEDITKPGGVLDRYADEIEVSRDRNDQRWEEADENGEVVHEDFREAVEALRSWMEARRTWINENISEELTHVYNTVTFTADGEAVREINVFPGTWLEKIPPGPEKEGYVFTGWAWDNDVLYDYESFEEDTELHAVYVPEEDTVMSDGIWFSCPLGFWADINYRQFDAGFTLTPQDTPDKNIMWESSDPDIAEINEYGVIKLKQTGETTITGTLHSGISGSYTLHVFDSLSEPYQTTERIEIEEEEFTIGEGQDVQIRAEVQPQPNHSYLNYRSEDESVAVVDSFGVIHGVSPGTTVIWVEESAEEPVSAVSVAVTVE